VQLRDNPTESFKTINVFGNKFFVNAELFSIPGMGTMVTGEITLSKN
jgi:hypothetical protein